MSSIHNNEVVDVWNEMNVRYEMKSLTFFVTYLLELFKSKAFTTSWKLIKCQKCLLVFHGITTNN